MKVSLVGLGNLGTAIGDLVVRNGHEAIGWEYNPDVVEEINGRRLNSRYLAGVELAPGLQASGDLRQVVAAGEILFVAIPSVFVQSTLGPVRDHLAEDVTIVNMAKGIDQTTGLTSFQTIAHLFPKNPKVMLSGPSVANEFARGLPTVVVLAGKEASDLLAVASVLDNDYFRTRFSDDEIGVELGGILKNIYAIGLGMFDGKSITSVNFRAVYLTVALEEIANMGAAMGANVRTFLYLSGIGDLLATALSEHSHNRKMGELLASGLSLSEIKNEMGVLPEGYNTLKIILYIAEKLHVSIPLAKGLWDVANGRVGPDDFISSFIRDFVE